MLKNAPTPLNIQDYLPADFFEIYYGKKHLYLPGAFTLGQVDGLMNLEGMDELFRTNAIDPDKIAIIRDGVASGDLVSKTSEGKPNLIELRDQIADGDTLIINGINEASSSVKRMSDSMALLFGHSTQVNTYITPPGKKGFPPHIDAHDVLVIQISGTKTWKIYKDYENALEHPTHDLEKTINWKKFKPIEKNVETFELSVGDMLYIPLGTMHAPFCTDDFSCHLTFGIHPISWGNYIQTACEIFLQNDPEFRRPSSAQIFGAKQDFRETAKALRNLVNKIIALNPTEIEHWSFRKASARNGVFAQSTISDALLGTANKGLGEKEFALNLADRADFRVFKDEKGEWHLWALNHKCSLDKEVAKMLLRLREKGQLTSEELRDSLGDDEAENIAEICREIGIAGIELV